MRLVRGVPAFNAAPSPVTGWQAALDAGQGHEVRGVRVIRPTSSNVQAAITPYLNKGTLSNCATFSIMLLGMLLKASSAPTSDVGSTP